MDEPVEDGVGDGRVGDHLVPVIDRQLAGHDGRAAIVPVVDNLQQVATLIVRQGGVVALAGVAVGLGAAFAGSRLIASLLYGVSPRDPAVFAATTLLLLTIALLACWFPARRAARLSPLEALRTE